MKPCRRSIRDLFFRGPAMTPSEQPPTPAQRAFDRAAKRGRRAADWFGQVARTGAVASCFVFLFAVVAFAQTDRRQNAPGQFDFYVLSLSWSPSYCEAARERGNTGRSQQVQCGGRPFSFVVH